MQRILFKAKTQDLVSMKYLNTKENQSLASFSGKRLLGGLQERQRRITQSFGSRGSVRRVLIGIKYKETRRHLEVMVL